MRQVPIICSGHTRAVVQVRFSGIVERGYFIISASTDGLPMLRDGRTGDWIGTFQGHKGAVWGASITPDALKAVTASADFTARLWDAVTGDEVVQFAHRTVVRESVFSNDAQLVLTGAQDKRIRIWDTRSPGESIATLHAFGNPIRTCAFLPGDDRYAVVASGNDLNVIDVRSICDSARASAAEIATNQSFAVPQAQSVTSKITFDNAVNDFEIKDDKLIVACGSSVEVLTAVNSTTSGSVESDKNSAAANLCQLVPGLEYTRGLRFAANSTVNSAAICNHCNTLDFAAACEDNNVFRYDAVAGKFQLCKGHSGKGHCVRFSPDGRLFASAADDGTIRLWQHTVGEEYGLWKVERGDE